MRPRHVLPLLALLLVPGCGGDDAPEAPAPRAAAPTQPQTAPGGVPRELLPPPGVPAQGDGTPVRAGDAATIRRWADTLRRGDERGAARVFALPSKFQNATPVLTLDSAAEALAVQQSLTCGSRVTELEGAGPYVVVTFRLTDRPGGDCGSGAGATARATLRVRGGRITEWYRLPEGAAVPDLGDATEV